MESVERFEAVIGLEVHAQLRTRTKIFCGCRTDFGAAPNSQTCPVCLGMPGSLPVLNRRAVALALRVGLATGCRINRRSLFARKNYFYPDLPKNYQISQYHVPLGQDGQLEVRLGGRRFRVGISRILLEEDAGKSLHGEGPGQAGTRIDLNRTGLPLLEIVTEPQLHSGPEAHAYLTQLRRVLVYLGVSEANLEEGNLRCDANISVRPAGSSELGTRVELKNLNSWRGVARALEFERVRQTARLRGGGTIRQETRSWEADRGETAFLRSKERLHDYRYFTEPDLPPLVLTEEEVAKQRSSLPELPAARLDRFESRYGLGYVDANVLTETVAMADYFEAVAARLGDPAAAANWIVTEVRGRLRERNESIESIPVPAAELADLLGLVAAGKISGRIAKEVFAEMIRSGRPAAEVVQAGRLWQTADESVLRGVIADVLAAHPDLVAEYRAGKPQLLAFFMGQVMRATRGRAHPERTRQWLVAELDAGE